MEYKFILDSSKFTITPEGFLDCEGACARIGNQTYSEDGKPFIEFRPEEEVFSRDSLESHKLKPITIRHPEALVDSENFQGLNVGVTGFSPRRDGDFLLNDFRVMDKNAVEGILSRRDRGESTEISMGYDRTLDKETGEFRGKQYDGIQRNIRINHAALLDEGQARAGSEAKLRLDNNNGAQELALYLLNQNDQGREQLHSIIVDKTVVETLEEAKKTAGEFGKIDEIEHDQARGTFEFIQDNHLTENKKTFSVPGKRGVRLVFGTLNDERDKNMPKLIRKAVNIGTFRMDALTGDYHQDSETIILAMTTKLDEAIECIGGLTNAANESKGGSDRLQAKADELEKENKKIVADIKELSDVNSDRVQAMMLDHAELKSMADYFKIDSKGKTKSFIIDAVILADDENFKLDGRSDEYKKARFDLLSDRIKKDKKDFDSSKESFGTFRKNAQDSKVTEKKDARKEFKEKSADAYKGKLFLEKKYGSQ